MTPNSDTQNREKLAFKKFIEPKKVLIADPGAASRSGIFKVLRDLGAKTNNLILANTFHQAETVISSEKPHIVVAEYELGKRCGLELLQTQREQRPDETKECIFIIITGNTSQTAVARSAEEDIDAYIIKPYTADSVRKLLIRTAISKIRPSEYYQFIEAGKKLIIEGKLKEAEDQFIKATKSDPAPALACYYIGQVKYMEKILEQAKGSYQKGLEFNKIHYKCMVGFYDLLMVQQEYDKAYDIVKKISQYFPANPKRLAEVLRLAIINGKFEDIEKYYSIFSNIDERDEILIKYVCAALVVCAKYYLNTKVAHTRSLELLRKAAVTGQGRVNILKEIILTLLEYNLVKDAKEFLKRFPVDTLNSPEFLICEFLISNKDGTTPSLIVEKGRALLAQSVLDERLHTVMIERSIESNLIDAAEGLIRDAAKKFPAKKVMFEKYLEQLKKRK